MEKVKLLFPVILTLFLLQSNVRHTFGIKSTTEVVGGNSNQAINSTSVCDSMLKELVLSSNFLEKARIPQKKLWKRKIREGEFTIELDNVADSATAIVRVYSTEEGSAPFTLAWLAIDSKRNRLSVLEVNKNVYVPVKCNLSILQYVIKNCINWR